MARWRALLYLVSLCVCQGEEAATTAVGTGRQFSTGTSTSWLVMILAPNALLTLIDLLVSAHYKNHQTLPNISTQQFF